MYDRPLCRFDFVIGATHEEAPVGILRERRPDLLSVDDPLVTVEHRARLHVGEIGTGVGLAVALAPHLAAREDLRDEAALLCFGAVRHDRRPGERDAHVGYAVRRTRLDVGHEEDDLLGQRALAATDVLGIVDAQPAALGELALPLEQRRDRDVLLAHSAAPAQRGELADHVLFEPGAHFVLEGDLCRRQLKIHGA